MPFGNLKALQEWDVSFPMEMDETGQYGTDPSTLYPYQLLIIDTIQIVDQLLELGFEVEIWSVVHQIQEGCIALIGFDGIWLVLFRSGDIGVGETLKEYVPAFLCYEGVIFALLVEECLGFFRNSGHSTIDRQQFVRAGGDEVSQDFKGFVGVLGALPDAESIGVNAALHFAIGSYRLNAELEFIACIAELAQAAGVPGLGQAHRRLAGVEDIASQEFRRTGERPIGDEGLLAPHAIIVPLEGFLPTVGDRGFVAALGIPGVDLLSATVECTN